jgi:hypothetical protein
MSNERIKSLNLTVSDVITMLAGGNPGALRVCIELYENTSEIDPNAGLGGLGTLLSLDALNIWDHRIWMFYKDFCGEDLGKMLAVMRAYQLGQLEGCTQSAIDRAIDNYGEGLDLDKIIQAVQTRLPKFNSKARVKR